VSSKIIHYCWAHASGGAGLLHCPLTDLRFLLSQCHVLVAGRFSPLHSLAATGRKIGGLFLGDFATAVSGGEKLLDKFLESSIIHRN